MRKTLWVLTVALLGICVSYAHALHLQHPLVQLLAVNQ